MLDRPRQMTLESRPVKHFLKRILSLRAGVAIALMFWCAGAGCMMVSYARSAMNDTDGSAQSAEQSMATMSASMDAHACCKAKHKPLIKAHSQKRSVAGDLMEFALPPSAPSGAMSCCPLTSGSIV